MKLRTKITAAAVSLLLLFSAAFSLWNLSLMQTSILRVLIKSEWQQLNTAIPVLRISLEQQKWQQKTLMQYLFQTETIPGQRPLRHY